MRAIPLVAKVDCVDARWEEKLTERDSGGTFTLV